jgi:tRNA A-37 threonylcarbamoyl transferase component Bud32
VCLVCINLIEGDGPCMGCRTEPGGAGGARPDQTIVSDSSSSQSVKGFPDEGGRFGRYQVLSRMAEGGMGVVFKALDVSLNREVALKVMRGGVLASKLRRQRFLQEAEAAAGLQHPNIVPIYEIAEHNGYPFYTMDLVEGITLDEHVRRHACEPREITQMMVQVADAVQHFHQRGIIHRDLKPENLMVGAEGPRVIDFGIAKKIEEEESGSWTVEGDLLGTPLYMAPEQAAGRNREIDTRSDVYALGVILYELLTGAAPFKDLPQAKLLVAIQDQDPVPVRSIRPEVDQDLDLVVHKAMAKEPERRYQSAAELAQDLTRYLEFEPILARPATYGYKLRKFVRRHRQLVVGTGLVVALACAVAVRVAVERQERLDQIARQFARAEQAELTEQMGIYERILGQDPGNALAQARLSAARLELDQAEARENLEEERRLAEEREERLSVEEELQRERARAALEREQARERSEAEARARAEEQGRELLGKALQRHDEGDELGAIGILSDALVVTPVEATELRESLERSKAQACLSQAAAALDLDQAGLASFWLSEARKLNVAGDFAEELDRLQLAVEGQTSGARLVAEARLDLQRGELLIARAKLEQARDLGLEILDQLGPLQLSCEAEARRLVAEADELLHEDKAALALARAREALRYDPRHPRASDLVERAAGRLARQARARAVVLTDQPETRGRAVEVLHEAQRMVEGTSAEHELAIEAADRLALLRREREDLLYVPGDLELGLPRGVLITRYEITNTEFQEFVTAGGYEDPSLFDPEALALVAEMVDGTPGAERYHGPRTWRRGSFGDPANGARPVRGVTFWEAQAYARWLSQATGETWRLPTVVEWELAAGWDPAAELIRAYPWGASFEDCPLTFDAALLHVGSRPGDRSPLGLQDAGGSVTEWVLSGDGPAVKGAHFSADRSVARRQALVRTTGHPGAAPPHALLARIGFRLVLVLPEWGE